jgi:hypothetical protein
MAPQTITKSHYPVEISGWDAQGTFFVDKAILEWGESGAGTMRLRRRMSPGTLVFLRLLTPVRLGKDCPSPHNVEVIEGPDYAGWCKLRLVQSQPRHAMFRSPDDPLEHLIDYLGREGEP